MASGRTHAKVNKRVVTIVAPPVMAASLTTVPILAIPLSFIAAFFTMLVLLNVNGIFKQIFMGIVYGVLAVAVVICLLVNIPESFFTISVGISYIFGLIFGYLITPDSDQEGVTYGERATGRVLSAPFKFFVHSKTAKNKLEDMFTLISKVFMYPYALAIDHRSPHSHLVVWADFWRILYVIIGLVVVASVFIMMWKGLTFAFMRGAILTALKFVFSPIFWQEKLMFFIGSCIMTLSHLAMDGFKMKWT